MPKTSKRKASKMEMPKNKDLDEIMLKHLLKPDNGLFEGSFTIKSETSTKLYNVTLSKTEGFQCNCGAKYNLESRGNCKHVLSILLNLIQKFFYSNLTNSKSGLVRFNQRKEKLKFVLEHIINEM